jgi:hypothetical protein
VITCRGIYYLLLQGRRVSRASGNWYGYREKEDCALSEPIRARKTLGLLLYPEDGVSRLFQKCRQTSTRHVVIYQQEEILTRPSLCLTNALDLYSRDPGFESRPGYRLCPLRFLVVYLSQSGTNPQFYLY